MNYNEMQTSDFLSQFPQIPLMVYIHDQLELLQCPTFDVYFEHWCIYVNEFQLPGWALSTWSSHFYFVQKAFVAPCKQR